MVKELSKRLGFDYCGIAKAEQLEDDARHLEAWLHKGYNAGMSYMERNFDLRINPQLLVPGAQSVITLMMNYYPDQKQDTDAPQIAKYAYGHDYHEVIRAKLHEFLFEIQAQIGEVQGRGFVDSAPVLERSWAQRTGLGWIGKNANLINKQSGSFFFLATLIVDLSLEYDDPFAKDFCGTCTKCIDACPTQAIVSPSVIDANKCISYLTIELKDELIPDELSGKFKNWMFGCDICQDVCPWNRFSQPHQQEAFKPIPEILNFSSGDWESLDEDFFKVLLKNSPIKRSKWKGIRRNISFIKTS
ncbi:tRNA epoxyqueuosine(34) reductase QueG [Taibaiella sp. KBW10]|uniref:tRNA epoxyqueuosine(34) reductase QueG n=1 Tax=Taibaiella sp. KBW10 TaxID=2153357 RepID=UPI002100A693|nr:tRNA epoxyqueuosine(34) reductase QueG [Taibaiella sp. KBW10]